MQLCDGVMFEQILKKKCDTNRNWVISQYFILKPLKWDFSCKNITKNLYYVKQPLKMTPYRLEYEHQQVWVMA